MASREDLVVFILSNGRPNRRHTYDLLRKHGYTGRLIVVVDDEDPTVDEYRRNFDDVYVFSKSEASKYTDTCDNTGNRKAVVFARNACFRIAKELGYKYFVELDDDYAKWSFRYRYYEESKKTEVLKDLWCHDFDKAFSLMVDFLEESGALSVAFGQNGDLIGGTNSPNVLKPIKRKVMNSFFCKTERRFDFSGRMNDDVNAYTMLGNRGNFFLSIFPLSIMQVPTQKNDGGLTELYKENGTYQKSFYSVMVCPSGVKVDIMSTKHARVHHKIDWNRTCPKVIDPTYRKS